MTQGIAYWAAQGLLFVSSPGLGVIATRLVTVDDGDGDSASSGPCKRVRATFRIPVEATMVARTEVSGIGYVSEKEKVDVSALHVDEQEEILYILFGRSAELHAVDLSARSPGRVIGRYHVSSFDQTDGSLDRGASTLVGITSGRGNVIFFVSVNPPGIFSLNLTGTRRCKIGVRLRGQICR